MTITTNETIDAVDHDGGLEWVTIVAGGLAEWEPTVKCHACRRLIHYDWAGRDHAFLANIGGGNVKMTFRPLPGPICKECTLLALREACHLLETYR